MNKTAIVIVGGFGSPDVEWNLSPLVKESALHGVDSFIFRKCSYGLNDIKHNATNLLQFALNRKHEYGYEKLFLVGHSMGGLVCRMAELYDYANDITGLVTVATPHYGTVQAKLGGWFSKSARQMEIQSDFLSRLNANPARKPVFSVVCKYDELVWPMGNAIYRNSDRVEKYNLTHVGPIFSKKVARDVLQWVHSHSG